jgi:peroxiredoxin
MKKFIFANFMLLALLGCNGESQKKTKADEMKEIIAANKADVDLRLGSSPKKFSAKAVDGSTFNSAEHDGKYWIVFVYQNSYLKKSESYDLVAELNTLHQKYGNQFPMVGIVNGFSDDAATMTKSIVEAKFSFKQIDNTQGPGKEEAIKENVYCTPAKILIDPKGKVVYNGCGGNTDTFDVLLDSLFKSKKL